MNYQIIKNEYILQEFIDWLPDLQDNEVFYVGLFARKKYAPELVYSNDRTQLRRFTANKENLFHRIKQLEVPIGSYWLKDREVPQKALALYISVNPRDMEAATHQMGKQCWELIRSKNFNLHQEALSCIQRCTSRKIYKDFDIDEKSIELDIPWLNELLGENAYEIVETNGGYHILVNLQKVKKYEKDLNQQGGRNWYLEMINKYPIDLGSKPDLLPVPGCVQGEFMPRFKYRGPIFEFMKPENIIHLDPLEAIQKLANQINEEEE